MAELTVTTSVTINSDGSITIKGTANKSCSTWKYKIDGGSLITFSKTASKTASIKLNVEEGKHTVNVYAIYSTSEAAFGTEKTVDTTKPKVLLTDSKILVNQVEIKLTSQNQLCSSWEYSIDNGETWVVASTSIYEGTITVTIDNLSADTFYIISARARSVTNKLYGYSNSINIKTLLGAAYISGGNGYKKAICYVNYGNLHLLSESEDTILSEDGNVIFCEDENGGGEFKPAIPYIYTLDGWKQTYH